MEANKINKILNYVHIWKSNCEIKQNLKSTHKMKKVISFHSTFPFFLFLTLR